MVRKHEHSFNTVGPVNCLVVIATLAKTFLFFVVAELYKKVYWLIKNIQTAVSCC